MLSMWLREALEKSGLGQATLARELTARLGRSIDRAAVNKMVKGTRKISADEMMAISEITAFPTPAENEQATTRVPVISSVSAGTLCLPAATVAPEEEIDAEWVSDLGPGEWYGLRVDGDSMDRISPPGSVVVFNRRETQLISNRCYIFRDDDGRATYKRFRADPPRLEPVSTNPTHEPTWLLKGQTPPVIGRVRVSIYRL